MKTRAAGKRRRQLLGDRIAREIDSVDLEKKEAARAMGFSKTAFHNILAGRSRLTPAAAVRLAAVLEDAQRRAVGGPFETPRVARRARELLMMQAEVDIAEATASASVARLLDRYARMDRKRRRNLPRVPMAGLVAQLRSVP